MFKIGILGAENSHASGFSQIINGFREDCKDEFADMQVVAIGGHYPEANQKVVEKYNIDMLVDKPEDMLGKVDAIMVTARDGKYHAAFARPFIEAGIPAFIDKPFTSDPHEALELARLAKSKGVPLVGGSSLKLCDDVVRLAEIVKEQKDLLLNADVTAPVSLVNEYGGFWFYAAHLVEICLRVFGHNPQWVWANQTDRGVTAILHYPEFDVTHHFIESAYQYSITLNMKKEIIHQPLDITDFTLIESRSFAKMLREGTMDFTYEELVNPVFVLDAIAKSMQTGHKVEIEQFEI